MHALAQVGTATAHQYIARYCYYEGLFAERRIYLHVLGVFVLIFLIPSYAD